MVLPKSRRVILLGYKEQVSRLYPCGDQNPEWELWDPFYEIRA